MANLFVITINCCYVFSLLSNHSRDMLVLAQFIVLGLMAQKQGYGAVVVAKT